LTIVTARSWTDNPPTPHRYSQTGQSPYADLTRNASPHYGASRSAHADARTGPPPKQLACAPRNAPHCSTASGQRPSTRRGACKRRSMVLRGTWLWRICARRRTPLVRRHGRDDIQRDSATSEPHLRTGPAAHWAHQPCRATAQTPPEWRGRLWYVQEHNQTRAT